MKPVWITIAALAILAFTDAAKAQVALPADVRVIPPSSEVAREVAAFSGEWRGIWSGKLEATLIVEDIDNGRAKVIYAWGDAPDWRIAKGFSRHSAQVVTSPKPQLRFGGNTTFTVEMGGDLKTVTVTRVSPMPYSRVDTETFKRVGQ